MRRIRVIPVLLLKNNGLVKTIKFTKPAYVGDPINSIKIFNEKEVEELIILDINASRENRDPNYDRIKEFASECFMPFTYGGGIRSIDQITQILKLGVEKVSINSAALDDSNLIREASTKFGSQSIVVSIDIKKQFFGKYKVYSKRSKKNTGLNPIEYAKMMEDEGAGELFINNIDRDGTLEGYDLELISEISSSVGIPIIACGGAANVNDFLNAVNAGASAVAAGSMFVFKGSRNSVLINFPTENELFQNLYNKLI